MALWISVDEVTVVGPKVWAAQLSPAEVRRFGDTRNTMGTTSVLGVILPRYDEQARTLSIDPEQSSVLNIGMSDHALLIDLGSSELSHTNRPKAPLFQDSAGNLQPSTGLGDQAFLAECRRHLDAHVQDIAEELVSSIRRMHPGKLHEGLARKWVNHPENFFAITIQNRDMSLAVHVKGAPGDFSAPLLDIRQDRGSYCRFKLKSKNQLQDAIQVILESAQR